MKNEVAVIINVKIFERDGKQWTTSLNIADVFDVPHDEVLKRIRNCQCSQAFAAVNFHAGEYADKNNQMRKMYDLTRDGFSFLVMGFTGTKAAQFKEAYIEAFNKMENHLKAQADVSDRFVLVYEKFHNDFLELQKKNQEILESVSGNVNAMGHRVEKVEDDISVVKDDVADIKKEITNFKNVIPLTRRKVSKQDRRIHRLFVADHFSGGCPICKAQIIDGSKQEKDTFCIDHEINRHERGLDQTWAICKSCNIGKSNGTINVTERGCRSLFDSYHVQLQLWLDKKPKQLGIYQVSGH